ncbi:MAG: polysaccharide biosynthesis C-terminal domain-containing protein, partial [Lachnospiraceae bacterium]
MSQESKTFYRKTLALVIPMALQNLINVGISSIDVIMLGKVGEKVLSGASLGAQVQFIMGLLLFGVTSGAAVLMAQYWGKRDMRSIETVFSIAVKIALAAGVLFTIAALAVPQVLMSFFTNDDEVMANGVMYLRVVSFSYIPNALTMIYLNSIRSMEKVGIGLVTYLFSLVTNIIVNALLIFGYFGFPKLGVVGAAAGTVAARIVEFI